MLDFLRSVRTEYRPQSVVLLDFGSSHVKAAILDLTTFKPTLIGLGEEPYKSATILSGLVSDLDDYLLTIRTAIRKASFSCGFTPKDFVFSLSGEFVKTITVDLKVHRESEGPVKEVEVARITKEIDRLVYEEASLEFGKITGSRRDFKVLEKTIISLETLQGVRLERLSSVIEPDFRATVLVSFASLQTERLLTKVISDLKRNVLFKTSQISSLVGLLKKTSGNSSGIFIDFGGQVTDIHLVINGRVLGGRTVLLGGRDLTLELVEKYKISEDEAEEKKVLGDYLLEDIESCLYFWFGGLNRALLEISEGQPTSGFPVFLFGGAAKTSHLKGLHDRYSKENPNAILSGRDFKDIDQKIIRNSVDVKDEKIDSFEPLLSLSSQIIENYVSNQF